MSEEAIKQILLEIEKENAIDETGELREGLGIHQKSCRIMG